MLGHRKDFVKKRNKIHFSIFIENRNWDLKFVFQFDNENEKRKKFKILFHFKTKIECPFRPTDCLHKGPFRVFDILKNEIQNCIIRFCFYFNKKDETQIIDNHFHV